MSQTKSRRTQCLESLNLTNDEDRSIILTPLLQCLSTFFLSHLVSFLFVPTVHFQKAWHDAYMNRPFSEGLTWRLHALSYINICKVSQWEGHLQVEWIQKHNISVKWLLRGTSSASHQAKMQLEYIEVIMALVDECLAFKMNYLIILVQVETTRDISKTLYHHQPLFKQRSSSESLCTSNMAKTHREKCLLWHNCTIMWTEEKRKENYLF